MMKKVSVLLQLRILFFKALGFALSIIFSYKSTRIEKIPEYPLPPGPAGDPIVGCLPEMVRNKPTFRWMHDYMQKTNTEIACFCLGGIHVITVTSPELARGFLKEQDAIFASRPESMSARLASDGYLSTALAPAGDQWKKMRRILKSEVLTTGVHGWLHAKRCEEADHLVRYVYNQYSHQNRVLNVRDVSRHFYGCMIRKLVFGERFFGPGSEDGGPGIEEIEHMDAVWITLKHTYGFAIADYVPLLEIFDLDGHKKILTSAIDCLRKYHDPLIDHRVEMWRNGVRNTTTNQDFLDILISLRDSNDAPLLSIQEIKAQIIDITVGAIDNPSNAVEWAMAEMINEPRILNMAIKELDEVVGKKRLVQESDLAQLNYIKACVKEALRLHPVAPFNLPHVSTEDTVVGGYLIPKGSHVLLSRLGLGRNPRVWDDPLEFKPERHLVDGCSSSQVLLSDSQLRMWSFGVGRRGCPAIVLGSTILTIFLARLIHAFTWTPLTPDVPLVEAHRSLFLAKPFMAHATPRLEPQVYHQILF